MQNTSVAHNHSHWHWTNKWTWAVLGFNNAWLRRFTTFIMGILILTLATVALADTTDYDVLNVSIDPVGTGQGLTLLDGTNEIARPAVDCGNGDQTDFAYNYILNDNGTALDKDESGLASSIKLTDDGFDGPLPGDLCPGDVVEVTMNMDAIKQGNTQTSYAVSVDMVVLSEPATQLGAGNYTSWVGFNPDPISLSAPGSAPVTETVTISIPSTVTKVSGKYYVAWNPGTGSVDLLCNAGDLTGPDGSSGWYGPDLEEDGTVDSTGEAYCYKVKVQGRSDPGTKFGHGSGMVIYFNIDPPAPEVCSYTFGGFLPPIQGSAGSWYRYANNAKAGTSVKFQMYDSNGLLSDENAAKLVNTLTSSTGSGDCELVMKWALPGDAEPGNDSLALRQGTGTTTFSYDATTDQFNLPLNINGSGMTNGHDYLLTVYLTDGTTTGFIEDGGANVARFLLHVAHP